MLSRKVVKLHQKEWYFPFSHLTKNKRGSSFEKGDDWQLMWDEDDHWSSSAVPLAHKLDGEETWYSNSVR